MGDHISPNISAERNKDQVIHIATRTEPELSPSRGARVVLDGDLEPDRLRGAPHQLLWIVRRRIANLIQDLTLRCDDPGGGLGSPYIYAYGVQGSIINLRCPSPIDYIVV